MEKSEIKFVYVEISFLQFEQLSEKLLNGQEEIVAILLELGRVATFAGERNHISPKWFPPLISDHRGGG